MTSNPTRSGTPRKTTVVCNAGPLIHLDELGCVDLLSDYNVLVPDAVWEEVTKIRPTALAPMYLTQCPVPPIVDLTVSAMCKAFSLDKGEAACVMFLSKTPGLIFLTDDAAARLVGENMGIQVHGTIGLIVRSIRRRTRTVKQVLALLDAIPAKSTLFIRKELLKEAERAVRRRYRLHP